MSQTGTSSNLDADPADAVECAALTWLVEQGKEPRHIEWCIGRQQWYWWREWGDVTQHTLPEPLYRHLPEQNASYSWCAFGTYQEAIAAFVAAYAAWQSSGVSEPGKGV
jgi:hypothetical protein